jgi:hypothetical protein
MFYWSDSPVVYNWILWGGWIVLLFLSCGPFLFPKGSTSNTSRPCLRKTILHPVVFGMVVGLWIMLARWPGLFYPVGFNIDEDQFLAAARATVMDPVFFRGAEAGSTGPMNIYPLLWPAAFGQLPSLFSVRLTGLLMLGVGLGSLYAGARTVWDEGAVRVAIVFVASFFGFISYWDFAHYTSEHASIFYFCVGWGVILRFLGNNPPKGPYGKLLAFLGGVSLGLIPLAKLQGAVWALVSGLVLVGVLWLYGKSRAESLKLCIAAILGGMLCTTVLVLLFSVGGVFDYFWSSYILNAIDYKGQGLSGWRKDQLFRELLFAADPMRPRDFLVYGAAWLGFFVVATLSLIRLRFRDVNWEWRFFILWCACWVNLGLALWTVLAPQRNYPHYLLYLAVPMALVLIPTLNWLRSKWNFPCAIATLCCCILLLPLAGWRWTHPHNWSLAGPSWRNPNHGEIASAILDAAQGGNGVLTVWGYNPVYHTKTGLIQGTRLATSSVFFNENALQEIFLRTFMYDLEKNQPSVFVDAVADGQFVMMTDRSKHGHEQIPEVADFVSKNYALFAEVDGVRVFRIKDQ